MKPTMSVAEAADALGISRAYAYRLIREDRFPVPVLKIGTLHKLSRAQVEAYREQQEAKAS